MKINFTDLDDKTAGEVVSKLTQMVQQGESNREGYLEIAEESHRIFNNQMWSEKDKQYFREKFGIDPYQIPAARAPLNRLISEYRSAQYSFSIQPIDPFSYERQRKGREQYILEYGDDFETEEQAGEYFDRQYDDEYAQAVEVAYDNLRIRKKLKHIEARCLENAIIGGLDFLKTTYSTKEDPDGEILVERKSIRQMLWDTSTASQDFSDVEYIGEVNQLYLSDLVAQWPEHADILKEYYSENTNFRNGGNSLRTTQSWKTFFKFEDGNSTPKVNVVDMWWCENEERFQLIENETGHPRLIKYGLEEDEIWELIKEDELYVLEEMLRKGELDPEFFARSEEEVDEDIEDHVREKYSLRKTQVKTFFKAVFTHDALFEFKRSPLPTGSHPYTPMFTQYTDGTFTSIISDIRDIVLAYNKAFMFREIMLANSAKGLLVLDRGAVHKSNYTVDDIKEMWTEIGGVIDLEVRGGRRLSDIFQSVNTIGEGLVEIRMILNDLEAKLFNIIGVNNAMLGMVGNEASGTQVRQSIQQGQTTNGILFDNFNSALETHIQDKTIPLVVADLMNKKPVAIRSLGENRRKWIELNYSEEFELFVDTMLRGEFQLRLEMKERDKQISSQNSAMLLNLAMSRPDAIAIEAALEFSDIPNVGKFLKRNRELIKKETRERELRMIDIGEIANIMAEYNIDSETAERIVTDLRKQRVSQLEQEDSQGVQYAQGNSTIQSLAAESERIGAIEQQT